MVTLHNEEGPVANPDVIRQDHLAELPADADALIAMLVRQAEGQSASSMTIRPASADAQATQAERVARIAANRAKSFAELRTSVPDLALALTAMRARVSHQFGKLSGMPCMPPQCIY